MKPIWQPSRQRVEAANLTAFIRAVENREALANPDALDLFASLPELES